MLINIMCWSKSAYRSKWQFHHFLSFIFHANFQQQNKTKLFNHTAALFLITKLHINITHAPFNLHTYTYKHRGKSFLIIDCIVQRASAKQIENIKHSTPIHRPHQRSTVERVVGCCIFHFHFAPVHLIRSLFSHLIDEGERERGWN